MFHIKQKIYRELDVVYNLLVSSVVIKLPSDMRAAIREAIKTYFKRGNTTDIRLIKNPLSFIFIPSTRCRRLPGYTRVGLVIYSELHLLSLNKTKCGVSTTSTSPSARVLTRSKYPVA